MTKCPSEDDVAAAIRHLHHKLDAALHAQTLTDAQGHVVEATRRLNTIAKHQGIELKSCDKSS